MVAEEAHEKGREGVIEAKTILEGRLLQDRVSFVFNVYDAPHKLQFDDPRDGKEPFFFDLRGHMYKKDPKNKTAAGSITASILAEVKNYKNGNNLLSAYKEFIVHAAIVGALREHKNSIFLFVSTVPFGCRLGEDLCSEVWQRQVIEDAELKMPTDLSERLHLLVLQSSFRRLLDEWK